ncbi:glycosyltransferase family 2 protein [Streptomyces sp. NPDC002225]|uniref:glycosyltransferase family 2 protein n=1 Tax=Streptomyces sp. NPDC002225 TaxID=3154413 RepID=UPI00332305AF
MPPRLSVVVPVHNVAPWLTECLRSLAEQTLADLEVVVVDDGSTDDSAALAAAFAARDGRFRLVGQGNGGPGHARNTGVRHCDPGARHLAFADGDDVLPPHAYELLTATLDRTGSDLATGQVLRLTADGTLGPAPGPRRAPATTRLRTHISRHWELAADRTVCNKVFRRSFWDEHAFAFPSGTRSEDLPVVLPAHFLARAVDVRGEPVHHWRERDTAAGTTGPPADVRGLQDRITQLLAVSAFLDEHRGPDDKRRYETHALSHELAPFMAVLPEGDEAYRRAFLTYANEFTDQVDPAVLGALPLPARLLWHLVRERRTGELLALIADERAEPGAFTVRGTVRRTAHYPALVRPVPGPLLRLGARDLPFTARLRAAHWRDGRLHLTGDTHLPGGPGPGGVRTGWLRAAHHAPVPLRLRTDRTPGRNPYGRDRAAFEAVVDPARIRPRPGGRERTSWYPEIGLAGPGLLRRAALTADRPTPPPPVHRPDGDHRIVPAFDDDGALVLHAERIGARFETHRAGTAADSTATVVIDGMVRDGVGPGPLRLTLTHHPSGTVLDRPVTVHDGAVPSAAGWRRFTTDLPLAALAAARPAPAPGTDRARLRYRLRLVGPDGRRTPLDVPGPVLPGDYPLAGDDDGPRALGLAAGYRGDLLIDDHAARPHRAGFHGPPDSRATKAP